MSAENANSGQPTAETSTTKQPPPNKPTDQLNESEFLSRQAEEAKAAMGQLLKELSSGLGKGADPRIWARQYPWLTVASSAVAGFVATSLLVPSKEQQALNKLAAIERALNPQPKPKPEPAPSNGDGDKAADYKGGSTSFMSMILREVIAAVRPALVSLLTAGVTAHASKPSEEEMQAAAPRENQSEYDQQANSGPTTA
jgi:hypothetical protein